MMRILDLFVARGCCCLLCVLIGISFFCVESYGTEESVVSMEEVEGTELLDGEEEVELEEGGELLELWEDKERLSKWVFALGIFWFTGNYIKWMKKAFAVKKS